MTHWRRRASSNIVPLIGFVFTLPPNVTRVFDWMFFSKFSSDENHSKTVGKKVANFELNLNLALNVDRHKKHKPESELLSVTEKNTTMDTNQPSAIKVAVRMRPLADNEKSDKTILIKDNKVLVLPKNECFEFDYCLNSSNPELFDFASQEMVYRKMGEPLLKNAFQGYNVCLFAYGQSGSGKWISLCWFRFLITNDFR